MPFLKLTILFLIVSFIPMNAWAAPNVYCEFGDRWSLDQADRLIASTRNPAQSVRGDCTGDNWYICREINDILLKARDHIYQTVDQNYDGIAKCKLCDFGKAQGEAKRLLALEKWLTDRYFYGAGGLGNIYYTVGDLNRYPACMVHQPGKPVLQPPATPFNNSQPIQPRKHVCVDSKVYVDATWTLYGYGGGSQSGYKEKQGMLCKGLNFYYKFSDSGLQAYQCESNYTNCLRDPDRNVDITKSERNPDGTISYFWAGGFGKRRIK